MKKQLLCIILLSVCILSCSCNKQTENTTTVPNTETETTAPSENTETTTMTDVADFGADTFFKRNGDILSVEFKNKEYADQQLSVLVLKDAKYIDSWKDNPDVVINIGQLTLDDNGEGSVELLASSEYEEVYVCISAQDGKNVSEGVKINEN